MNSANQHRHPTKIKPDAFEIKIQEIGTSKFTEVATRILAELLEKWNEEGQNLYGRKLTTNDRLQLILSPPPENLARTGPYNGVTLEVVHLSSMESADETRDSKVRPLRRQNNDVFLSQVYDIIEENFDNPQFQIDDLAKKLCMSRTQLYRKLKAKTGQSFTSIQRDLKVEKICQMLQSTNLSIAEISYKLGFKDPSYMSRTFKKVKKISPSRYQSGSY